MRRGDLLGPLSVGAIAVVCCAVLPSVVALVGGLTVAGILGGGLAVVMVALVVAVGMRLMRRREGCE